MAGLALDGQGNLFGTTSGGGATFPAAGGGTVFEIAAGSKTVTTLGSFNGPNGFSPFGGVVLDGKGNIYGTTYGSGPIGDDDLGGGTVFEIVSGSNTITTLRSSIGFYPWDGLVLDPEGDLYGTSAIGGDPGGGGSVFEIDATSPKLEATSPTWNTASGALDYGYTISNANLPVPTTVDLDWASGTTADSVIGNPIISTTTGMSPGTYPLYASRSQLGTPPAGATNLLVVADPENLVAPADADKVASLALTTIVATTPKWNNTDGGLDYGYTIGNLGLSQATAVELDWASGPTANTVIGSPIMIAPSEQAQGTYQLYASPSQLGTPPAGATYLLVVADPTNLVAPADPNKVASLVLPSIIAMAPQWSTTDGGVNYGYTIGNSELPQATTVDLEWASGLTVNTVIGTPILSTSTGTAQGSYQLHATPAKLGLPPAGARYLLVVVDSGNLVAPANPSKTASTPDTTATTPLAIVLGSGEIRARFPTRCSTSFKLSSRTRSMPFQRVISRRRGGH